MSPRSLDRSLRRRAKIKAIVAPSFDSDEEVVVESDCGDSDDEYVPTPPLRPLKRRRSQEPTASSFRSTVPVASSSRASSSAAARPTKRRKSSLEESSAAENWTASDYERWSCPHCNYIQWKKRTADFERHQATHISRAGKPLFVCQGVRLEHASACKKPIPTDKRGIPVEHEGVMRVGGCFRSFTRSDALKRHLEKTAFGEKCVTDYATTVSETIR